MTGKRKIVLAFAASIATCIASIALLQPLSCKQLIDLRNRISYTATQVGSLRQSIGSGDKDFFVKGIVTDESGNWIDGVFLDISESTPSFSGTTTAYQRSTYQQNVRHFDVHSKGYAALGMHFSKDGYERQHLGYTESGTYLQVHVILKRKA